MFVMQIAVGWPRPSAQDFRTLKFYFDIDDGGPEL